MRAGFLLLAVFLPLTAWGDAGLPTVPYLYVEGRAEVEKPADMVTLRFELSGLDADQATANKAVQAQARKVFELFKTAKIVDQDVIASDLSSEAQYEQEEAAPNQRGKLVGYRVTRPFTVKIREIAKFPALVDKLMGLGVESFSGITEGLAQPRELEDQVWAKALANARERADKTAAAAGVKIDSVFAISPVTFPEILRNVLGDSHQWAAKEMAMDAAKTDPSQYRLAPVSVHQTVHVIYLISGAR